MPSAARILVLSLALLAATCGQKGPLTPPDSSANASANASAGASSQEEVALPLTASDALHHG